MKSSRWQIGVLAATVLVALAAAGCTGTDIFPSGNARVTFEMGFEGATVGNYDCVNLRLLTIRVRPLTGTCSGASTNAGDACLVDSDCPNGTCENSEAGELISDQGILVLDPATTSKGNLLGEPCVPTTKVCSLPVVNPQIVCTQDADCVDPDPSDNVPVFPPCILRQDAVAAPFVPVMATTLSEGLYQINVFSFERMALYADDPFFFGRCGSSQSLVDFLGKLRFAVEPEGDQVVRIVIDVDELAQALPGLESCTPFTAAIPSIFTCEYGPPGNTVPCLSP